MATHSHNVVINSYSIKELMQLTYESSEFNNRYDYALRDCLKSIVIEQRTSLKVDRLNQVSIKFRIKSFSYPQYHPYLVNNKDKRGRTIKWQRSVKHQYNIVLELNRLSINTKVFKMRVGSQAYPAKAPQNLIQSIYRENLKVWSKEKIKRHREIKKPYLNSGDWESSVLGINQDWLYRSEWIFSKLNLLYGVCRPQTAPVETHSSMLPFLNKHILNLLQVLMRKGILKDN
jgi:hypothetical protein